MNSKTGTRAGPTFDLPGCARADKDGGTRADWAHAYLAVLPPLPLNVPKDEAKIAVALRYAS